MQQTQRNRNVSSKRTKEEDAPSLSCVPTAATKTTTSVTDISNVETPSSLTAIHDTYTNNPNGRLNHRSSGPSGPVDAIATLFRRKTSVTPRMNYTKTYYELLSKLSSIAFQMQCFHLTFDDTEVFNRLRQTAQCIRSQVASGVACVNPIVVDARDRLNDFWKSPDSRILVNSVYRFLDAYSDFDNWVTDASCATIPPHDPILADTTKHLVSASPTVLTGHHFLQGMRLLEEMTSSALTVFDLLKSSGSTESTSPVASQQFQESYNTSVHHEVDSKTVFSSNNAVPSHDALSQSNNDVLTEADRALLVKLWSHLDTLFSAQSPPKPFANHRFRSSVLASHTAKSDLFADASQPLTDNSVPDQHAKQSQQPHDSSKSPKKSSGTFFSHSMDDVTLNVSQRDSLPSVGMNSSHLVRLSHLGRRSLQALHRALPVLPDADLTGSMQYLDGRSKTNASSASELPVSSLCTAQPNMKSDWHRALSTDSLNPLDDHHMQENIATAAMQLQNSESQPATVEFYNPLCPAHNPIIPGHPRCDPAVNQQHCSNPHRPSTHACHCCAQESKSGVTCHSEFKDNTQADWELIEVDGKKYRRYFERRVLIHRHKVRQVVLAPALPDGTGPDMSRAVSITDDPEDSRVSPTVPDSPCSLQSPAPHTSCLHSERSARRRLATFDDHGEAPDSLTSEWDADSISDSLLPQEPLPVFRSPPKPKYLSRAVRRNRTSLGSYIFRFGMSVAEDDILHKDIPADLLESFHSKWMKNEQTASPLDRRKTISYVQDYAQRSSSGELIHKSTCVEHTCRVRMLNNLEGLPTKFSGPQIEDDTLETTSLDRTSGPLNDEQTCESLSTSPSFESLTTLPQLKSGVVPCVAILQLEHADDFILWSRLDTPKESSVVAGCIDALITHLTSPGKHPPSFKLFVEAFLTTYRTFMSSEDLIHRLIMRYTLFRSGGNVSLFEATVRSAVCALTSGVLQNVVFRLKCDLTPSIRSTISAFQETLLADHLESLSRVLGESLLPDESESALQNTHCVACSTGLHHLDSSVNDTVFHNPPSATVDDLPPRWTKKVSFHPTTIVPNRSSAARSKRSVSTETTSQLQMLADNPGGSTGPSFPRQRFVSTPEASLLCFSARDLAEQLTYLEARMYDRIHLRELIDIRSLERGEAVGVSACATHFSAVSNWATFQLLKVPAGERDKIALLFLDVMNRLLKLRNYSTFLSLLCALSCIPGNLLSKKATSRLERVTCYMEPPLFSKYRSELEAATPPFIPYLGVIIQNLIMLAQGNPLFLDNVPDELVDKYCDEHGPIVNFWRSWKHFLIIHPVIRQDCSVAARYGIQPNSEILCFIDGFRDTLSEGDLRILANRLSKRAFK